MEVVTLLNEKQRRTFSNGSVYLLETADGYPLEVTDTFLPFYTKDCINGHTNELHNGMLGSRKERWMIGVSCMSGCPVHCRFCATGKLHRWRNLTAEEIYEQVTFILDRNEKNGFNPKDAKEFKINYTRMGEPFLNIDSVRGAMKLIDNDRRTAGIKVHHYISTIGVIGSDFSWIKDNITLQVSLHSLDDRNRDDLIPFKNKLSIEELGQIRTQSNLKTTVNMTLVNMEDFDIERLKKWFDPEHFFIKLSPINENEVSIDNHMGKGVITQENFL